MQFRMSSSEIDDFFEAHEIEGNRISYRVGNRTINYVHSGDESLPLVVFVHGSPGSLSAFIEYLSDSSLLKDFQMISVDRPGFGYSNFGEAEPSLEKQAALLLPILKKYQDQSIILVGHSLGGPVVARMAMDYPELVDAIVLVAPSIDPDLEPNEWYRGPLATPFLKWILPRSIRASNDEIWKLKPELQEMLPLWEKVNAKTVVIQGGKDKLVPPGNADFAYERIVNAPVELIEIEDMNHFVPWSHPHLIKSAILKLAAAESEEMKISAN